MAEKRYCRGWHNFGNKYCTLSYFIFFNTAWGTFKNKKKNSLELHIRHRLRSAAPTRLTTVQRVCGNLNLQGSEVKLKTTQ